MSTHQPERRLAVRSSRPNPVGWLTVMVVFSHRTIRWSLTRRTMLWIIGLVVGFSALAMIGSGYGFWATKKIMSFGRLQQETREQQEQLRSSLDQAQALETEVATLRQQHTELLKLLDPKAPAAAPLPAPPGQAAHTPDPVPPGVQERLSRLKRDLDYTAKQAAVVRARMEPVLRAWAHTPSIPPTAGYLSSGFGVRVNPFSRTNEAGDGLLGYHTGIDISNALDTPIQVTADGEVEEAGWMDRYGWGVRVRHNNEQETLYAHMNHVNVKAGQKVSRGDILGSMGRSGNATGVHLHYEVRLNGKPTNPQPYLRLQRQWVRTLGKSF
ncbi:M23 family metallopeptidase [Geothrix fuzhouensis]|uniref:M23 family metallopeptidase n=1 Tax=Geothrix fuzhouensis TaxID=2966451 RepID=UPI0021480074|nr:M23 family metallopeptidase [Geothrix fuzhouensis]